MLSSTVGGSVGVGQGVGQGGTILAHGIGGRGDLPVPFSLALTGAAAALVVSFVILAWSWPAPRFDNRETGRVLPLALTRVVDAGVFRSALRVLGLLATAYVGVAAIFGPDLLVNPTFGVVYVLLWVGLVPLSVVFGPVWRYLNPLRPLHLLLARLLRVPPVEGLIPLPARLGAWPAAVGLFAFVWLELVAPDATSLAVVRMWVTAYVVLSLLLALVYGARWFDRGDPFEAYSTLFGHLSPFARRPSDGRLVLRNPLAHLAGLGSGPGSVAVVAILLGSTAYDGFSQSTTWIGFVQGSGIPEVLAGTGALAGSILVAAGSFWLATVLAGGLAGGGASERTSSAPWLRSDLPGAFAGSVVPIVLGYLIAHYFTLLVLEGQQTFIYLSDPLANGANLLGLTGRDVDPSIANNPQLVAGVKVGAVVVGHVLGVIAAHDRAVALFPRRTALLGQIPLLVVMVCYTLAGLTLLFAT
ncbi:hypothetical protein ABN034_30665 [Actinopolymorpha sp. B11F2]|uniref:hypothetical protein n=1 Tax=Actinopolymorpha sp. B11F2 TaxID=3160862 RepID=UPI0032E4D2F1